MKKCKICNTFFNKPQKPKQIFCSRRCRTRFIATTHGFSKTPFYAIWRRIKDVCNKTDESRYALYGGRGIKCLWSSFEEFKHDMYQSYLEHIDKYGKLNTTIERINNDGHYSKVNCTWSTRQEQARNRRNGLKITYENKIYSLQQLSEIYKISRFNLWQRIFKYNWPIKKALLTKIEYP